MSFTGLSPLLILCPPRSFSSVVCAMLGQHPALYGFPELNLFLTNTVGELITLQEEETADTGEQALSYTSGVVRAIAELEFGAQNAQTIALARAWLAEHADWTTGRLLHFLLAAVAPRIGVDKSPRNVMSTQSLRRIDEGYSGSRFIHLTRHPISSIQSMLRLQGGSAASASLVNYCVRLCCSTHRRILSFLENKPASQWLQISGEALLQNPETELTRILQWLALEEGSFVMDAMLHPERSPFAFAGLPGVSGDNDDDFLRNPALRRGSFAKEPSILECDSQSLRDVKEMTTLLGYSSA